MLERLLEVAATCKYGGNVIARCRIVRAGRDPPLQPLNRQAAESGRLFRVAAGVIERAQLLVQFDERALAQRVVARGQVLELAPVLGVRAVRTAA